jgi:hypothetical protein
MRLMPLSCMLFVMILSCKNKQGFGSDSSGKSAGGGALTKTFQVGASSSGALDIVWSLDNSASMTEENSQVLTHLQQFQQALAPLSSDIKVAVLTCMSQGDPACAVPSGSDRLFPVPAYKVGDDVLAVLAASLCPANLTSLVKYGTADGVVLEEGQDGSVNKGKKMTADLFRGPVCGVTMDTRAKDMTGQEVFLVEDFINEAAGALVKRSVLRPGSQKIFIGVSDDNTTGYGAAQFKQAMDKQFGAGKYHFFAFAGKATSACPIVNQGLEYETLATGTGGEVFDICASDWSPQFDKLLAGIKKAIGNGYPIESAPGEQVIIQSVTLAGVPLNPTQYTYANGGLVLAASVVATPGAVLVVTYTKQPAA